MAIYVYNSTTGALVSWCPDDTDPVASTAQLAANGLASVSGLAPLDATHVWDASTKAVDTIAAPVQPNLIPTYSFIGLFTAVETAAIRASTDANVAHLLFQLQFAPAVDLNSALIQQGVAYLVSVSLLTQARATIILANQAPS